MAPGLELQTWVNYIIVLDSSTFLQFTALCLVYRNLVQTPPSGPGWLSCTGPDQSSTEQYLNVKRLRIGPSSAPQTGDRLWGRAGGGCGCWRTAGWQAVLGVGGTAEVGRETEGAG